jgi:hypothetical protein
MATLSFDTRYLESTIDVWSRNGLRPVPVDTLKNEVQEALEGYFVELNSIGLLEEDVASDRVDKAIAALKKLKLATEKKTGPKEAKIPYLHITSNGKPILSANPQSGGIRPQIVQKVLEQDEQLHALLATLFTNGPFSIPIKYLQPDAPTKKKDVDADILKGLENFCGQYGNGSYAISGKNAAEKIKTTLAYALTLHPIGSVKGWEKLIDQASALGLIWIRSHPLSRTISVKTFGVAAVQTEQGSYVPFVPDWTEFSSIFVEALIKAHKEVSDSTGFAAIEDIRGAIGENIHLSASIVDDFLCKTRELADTRGIPIRLHFEEDEELFYQKGRNPLIWRKHAFDYVEVTVLTHDQNNGAETGALYRTVDSIQHV